MQKTNRLTVPCCYQGGKQRIAPSIVNHLLMNMEVNDTTQFVDLCCGSGAISIELINRGISPERITMLDISSWGKFWNSIGSGRFSLSRFRDYLDLIPENRHEVHDFMKSLAALPASVDEEYKYLLLQASSFGGKQIWRENDKWMNAFFRSYWQPTAISVRRSPANPMQPQPSSLLERITNIVNCCTGLRCIHGDTSQALSISYSSNTIIYIDPPYSGTTGYGFTFNLASTVKELKEMRVLEVFVSECMPISKNAIRLNFGGPKGGISGNKIARHEEWLSACASA